MVPWPVDWSASAQYSACRHSWKESIDQSCCDSEYWEIIDTPLGLSYRLIHRPCRKNRQGLFNKLSNTIVIFIGKSARVIRQGDYFREP
jgi:hypothetical protein